MSARPRQEFVGKYTHEEMWDFAQRLMQSPLSAPAGFSVAASMIEQLLAERAMLDQLLVERAVGVTNQEGT